MENTNIEWADATINPWWGCTKVSPGCANCYAESWSLRFQKKLWGKGAARENHLESSRKMAVALDRKSKAGLFRECECGRREMRKRLKGAFMMSGCTHCGAEWSLSRFVQPRVFCASMSDWLDEEVPITWFIALMMMIRDTPQLHWLLLTKRPERFHARLIEADLWIGTSCMTFEMASLKSRMAMMRHGWRSYSCIHPANGIENYSIGTTIEDQARAHERIPALLQIPARRFLSCEPMLESLDLRSYLFTKQQERYCETCKDPANTPCDDQAASCPCPWKPIDWVICGGESGDGHRRFDADWARSLRDQCAEAKVPFFMKQMGGARKPFAPIPTDLNVRQFPAQMRGFTTTNNQIIH